MKKEGRKKITANELLPNNPPVVPLHGHPQVCVINFFLLFDFNV